MNILRYRPALLALMAITAPSICHAGRNDNSKQQLGLSPKKMFAAAVVLALGIRYWSHDKYYYTAAPVRCSDFPLFDEKDNPNLVPAGSTEYIETDPNTIYCLHKKDKKQKKIMAHIVADPQSNALLYREISCGNFQPISCDSRSCFAEITDWQQSDDRGVEDSFACLQSPYQYDPIILKIGRSEDYSALYDHIHE